MYVSDIHSTESTVFAQPDTNQLTVVPVQGNEHTNNNTTTNNNNNNNMALPQDVLQTQGTGSMHLSCD